MFQNDFSPMKTKTKEKFKARIGFQNSNTEISNQFKSKFINNLYVMKIVVVD
jgi:hypothetical protein